MVMRPLYEEMCNHWKSGRTVEADLVSDIHDGHIWKEFEDCVFSGSLPRMVWCWMSTGSFHSSIPPIQLGLHIWLTLTYLDLNVSIHPVNLGLEDRKGRDVSKWEGQIHFSVHHVTGIFLHIRSTMNTFFQTLRARFIMKLMKISTPQRGSPWRHTRTKAVQLSTTSRTIK